MPWVTPVTTVEAVLNGSGILGTWTDISVDVTNDPIKLSWGIKSYRPQDRCAGPGPITLAMRNDAGSSGGVVGYYAPTHANCRSGWGYNIPIRVKQVYGGVTRYLLGYITDLVSEPGLYEEQRVFVTAVTWLDFAARTNVPTTLQIDKRADEVFSAVIAGISPAPANLVVGLSNDIYPIALDNISANTKALSVIADLARNEMGYAGERRDATIGQTVFFEVRGARAGAGSPIVTLDKSMHDLSMPGGRADILNKFRATSYPRDQFGHEGIAVASLASVPRTPIAASGGTLEIWLNYTDPVQRDTRIGAKNQVNPVQYTDYTANTLVDGTGDDKTTTLGVVCAYFASSVKVTFTNTDALPVYVTAFQLRGDGVYALNPVTSEASDPTSVATYAENLTEFDLKYQSDPNVVDQLVAYQLYLYKDPKGYVTSVSFVANQSATLMAAAMAGDVTSVFDMVETMTGLTTAQRYFINGVDIEIAEFEVVTVTWYPTPADMNAYARLDTGTPVSQLDGSALLGWV